MTCVVCGAAATYWLCTNACARVHLAKGRKKQCAICLVDPKTKQVGTIETNRICRKCRKAPENAGWIRGRLEEPDHFVENRLEEHERWLHEQDRPLPELSPRYTRIAQLVIEREPVQQREPGRFRRRRRARRRWRAYSIRRIAEIEGCTKDEVVSVIDSIES